MQRIVKFVSGFYNLHPFFKTLIIVSIITVCLLAVHDVLFLIDRNDIRKWLITNLNVNLLLTTFNTTLLFSIFAMVNKEKGENTIKHSEANKRIKITHHHSKSTAKKLEIITRKQFAQEARIDMLEDMVLNKRNNHENN